MADKEMDHAGVAFFRKPFLGSSYSNGSSAPNDDGLCNVLIHVTPKIFEAVLIKRHVLPHLLLNMAASPYLPEERIFMDIFFNSAVSVEN